MLNYSALLDLIALVPLVLVFRAACCRGMRDYMNLWLLGWGFILLHSTAQVLDVGNGVWEDTIRTVSMLSLEMGGIAFIWAASRYDYLSQRFYLVSWILGLSAYTSLACWNIADKLPYYASVAVIAVSAGTLNYLLMSKRSISGRIFGFTASFALVLTLTICVYRNQMGYGIDAILTWVYWIAGTRYWQHFWRKTTGVLTTVGGFLAWGAAFPLGLLHQIYAPHFKIENGVWNIPKYIVANGILLTFLEMQIERTEHLALHDPLTALPNRRLLEDRLEKTLERAERNHSRTAVLSIDLDGFKQINDNHGHAAGDAFLRASALRLQSRVRKADTIARTGGDEFIVIVSDMTDPYGADVLAEKLQEDMDKPITIGTLSLRVRGSIGIAIYPDDGQGAAELCAVADAAMYEKKQRSKSAYL